MPDPADSAAAAHGHPSAHALHEYHLALAPRAAADGIAAHVAGCERCRADLHALEADHRRFDREVFPQTRGAIAARTTPWLSARWTWPSLGVLAAAAALLLLVRVRGDDVRAKGGPVLAVFVARGDDAAAVEDGKTRLHAGDRIRFVLSPGGLRHAVIASVDGAGHATIYFPFQGDHSAALDGKPRVEIPGSIELDDAPGPERIFAVLSAQPLPTATVRQALQALAARGRAALRQTRALPIENATVTSLLFEKTP